MKEIKNKMKYKIYKLVYNNEVIYIGYTTQKYLSTRKAQKYKIPIEIKKESSIELIEETDDKSREEYWRKYYEDLGYNLYNIRKGITGLSQKEQIKEWNDNNKEYHKEYHKEYFENNKEKIREYKREYYEKNKSKYKNT